jgi:hypothetical protein
VNVVESFNLQENQWNTLAPMPLATILPGYAEVGNLLYCFGGSNVGNVGVKAPSTTTSRSTIRPRHRRLQSALAEW